MRDESNRCQDHQKNLDDLDNSHQFRFFVFVRQLPRESRKQDKRQNEERRGDIDQQSRVEAQYLHALECDQEIQAIAKNIVVECAEKLGREKWRESALCQERELIRVGHGGTISTRPRFLRLCAA